MKKAIENLDPLQFKQILAIHDLCGYGKASLTIVLPILSLAGCEVTPLVTALFSAHTNFDHFSQMDTTSVWNDFMQDWNQLDVTFDTIYSGFLNRSEQVDLILDYYKKFPKAFKLVDPVMGDHGVCYSTITPDLCEKIRHLVSQADFITPNLTEAYLLLNEPYPDSPPSFEEGKLLTSRLLELGPKSVTLKGVPSDTDFYVYFATQNEPVRVISSPLLNINMPGTGDLFASLILAFLARNFNPEAAIRKAMDYVYLAMQASMQYPDPSTKGVQFETILRSLSSDF